MKSEKTQVTFNNTIEDTKDHSILTYSNYYGGAGVGIGDLNGDGLQDLVFGGNLADDEIYLNTGALKFENITSSCGYESDGGWSSGVIIADINNDGRLDIYFTRELYNDNPDLRKNKLYINQGNVGNVPKFKEQSQRYNLDNNERTRHACFLDYNSDGLLDIFLLNQPPNPGNYSSYSGQNLLKEEWAPRLMKNNGSTFIDVTKESGLMRPCYPNSVMALDYDKDGDTDLYVANDYEAPDMLWQNNGNGTFTEVIKEKTNHISYYSMGVDAGDINNDGYLDVMTLDMVAEDNYRIKTNMGGMYPEVFWKIVKQGGHHQYMFNAMHLNQEGLFFSDIAQLTGASNTDWSWSNIIADFDNDGWRDLYITNGLFRDIRNSDADRAFSKYVEHFIQEYLKNNKNVGDLFLLDILPLQEALNVLPSMPLENYAYRNNGDLSFEKTTKDWGLDIKSFSNGCAYGDLDNDGDLDLVVNNINDKAFIFRNNGNKNNNYLQVRLSDTINNRPTFGSKVSIVDGNGNFQYWESTNVRGMYSTSQDIAHFGLGNIQSIKTIDIEFNDGRRIIKENVAANQILTFDISGAKDVLTGKGFNKPIFLQTDRVVPDHIENNFDDYEKQVLIPHKMSTNGPGFAFADEKLVFLGGSVGNPSSISIDGGSTWLTLNDTLLEVVDAAFIDIDLDGDLDLYTVQGGNEYPPSSSFYQDRIYLNDNNSFTYTPNVLPKFRESGSVVRPVDIDSDGDLDLFIGGRHQPWSYPSPTSSRILLNEGGRYVDITSKKAKDLALIGMVTDAEWIDIDQDGDQDLIIVGEWMPITLLENKDGQFVKSEISSFTNGWWNSIHAVDIDNDGDKDFLLGNLGLNHKYKASVDEPFEVHYHDFDNNGNKDIVLSYYNFGEQYPLRGKSCSSQQIPTISDSFPSYDIFASSNLFDVYGTQNLEKALNLKSFEFGNGILMNEGNMNFKFQRLPNQFQISSINDFYTQDLNQDGLVDFVCAGNQFNVEIETPRNDAGFGMVGLQQSNGGWKFIPPKKSGIVLTNEIKKITKVADQEIIFIGHNSTSKFYKINQSKRE